MRKVVSELGAWACRKRKWFRIRGASMTPALQERDCVLVDTRPRPAIRVGDVVAIRDPKDPERVLVKRVGSVGPRSFAVRSDNPLEARDSRHFGSLHVEDLIGPATLVFTRHGRFRPAPRQSTSDRA